MLARVSQILAFELQSISNAEISTVTVSGRVDKASATETVTSGSIPDRVKPKTMKIGIHSFPA